MMVSRVNSVTIFRRRSSLVSVMSGQVKFIVRFR